MKANSETVIEEVRQLVAKIIETNPAKVDLDARFEDLGADSMMMLEILVAVEKKFKIEIPESDLPKMTSLKEIINILNSR